MRKAEKHCRKLRMGAVDFSNATAGPLKEIAFWDIAIQRKFPSSRPTRSRQGRHQPYAPCISPRLWRRKKKAANIETPTSGMSKHEMIQKRRTAKAAHKQAKADHANLRVNFLDLLPHKEAKKFMRKEAQRKMGMVSKRATGKLASKSVTKVVSAGQELTEKHEVEECLVQVNQAKVRASDDTPFMNEPLLSEFGHQNRTPNGQKVVDGTYQPPPGVDIYTQALLNGLKMPDSIKHPNASFRPRQAITTEDHIKSWRKAKIRTSSGMSGLHFGMFKTNIQDRKLADIDASICLVAHTSGYSLKRWHRGLDAQMLKRCRDFGAENQRTILLLEADYNMNSKAIGSDAMRMGERTNSLCGDNYGGRKWFRTTEVSLNFLLTCNSVWGHRGRAIIMSNDAKGCYDRIAHVVVDLALQRLGIPKPTLSSMIDTIQKMQHHIRTAFGDSEIHYGGDPQEPPSQGILQGNGAGPAGWCAIATVLIEIMKQHDFGYTEWSMIKQRAIAITCFAFVDDTDIIHSNNDPTVSTHQLIMEAQEALSLWEGMLRSTGGALAPHKSYWYLVEVVWRNGGWTHSTAQKQPGDLFLKNGSFQVQRLEPHQSREALGIQTRPDSNMADEKRYLKSKVQTWVESIRTKRLNREEAWCCFNVTIMKTLEYPLLATTFTQKDVNDIMRPLLKTILPMCGIQRNLPRALLYMGLLQKEDVG